MTRWGFRATVIAATMTILASPVRAQFVEDYRFKGRIVDTQGAPIAAVHVTFRDLETGARIVFSSKKDGTFDRRMVPHGIYEVRFEKEGYATRIERFDWSAVSSTTIVKDAEIVMESQGARAEREMSKKAAQLYDEAYAALTANDCATAQGKAMALLDLGAGDREYAVRFVLARCHAQAGADSTAAAEYAQVIALKPDLFEAHFDLGGVLERLGQHERAVEEFVRAAALRPDDAESHYNAGALLFDMHQFDAARSHLERAVAADSTHALAYKALGYAHLQGEQKDLVAARRALERYLVLQPQAPDSAQVREIIRSLATPAVKPD